MFLKSLVFLCLPLTLLAEEKQTIVNTNRSDFFTAECLEQFDAKGLPGLISEQLKRAGQTIPRAEKMVRTEDPETEALGKRLELVRYLLATIKKNLTASDKESLIFAWQGAEELRILLNYFEEEEKRLETLRTLPPPTVISVKAFGAVGDGKTDDGPAIQRALNAAAEYHGKPVVVKIPAGVYLVGNHHDAGGPAYTIDNPLPAGSPFPGETARIQITRKRTHLLLQNVKNLTVEGEVNTHLRFTDPVAIAFRVLGSENVTLKNFSVDYVNLPFTQGAIIATDNQTGALTIRIDAGYPLPTEERFLKAPERRLTPHDAAGRYGLTTYRLGKIEAVGDSVFRVYPFLIKPGTQMWNPTETSLKANIIARYDPFEYDAYAIDLRYCKFCKIEGVTIHSSPAGAFRNMSTYAISLIGNRIETPEKSDRLISTNADGCQARGLIAPFVKNCVFSQLEDDGINFNSTTPEAEAINANREMLTPALTGGAFFVNSLSGQVHAIAMLTEGKSSKPLAQVIRTKNNLNQKEMSHAEKLALGFYNGTNREYAVRPDRIITIPSTCSGGVITGSTFRNIRGLGIQITAPNSLVENCVFYGNSGSAIHANAMLGWGMVFNTHNVIVRNCAFRDFRRTAISCSYHPLGSDRVLPPRQLRDLRFEHNVFEQAGKESLLLQNCADVTLTENLFLKRQASPFVIKCDNSTRIKGNNNRFSYPNANVDNSFFPLSMATQFQDNCFENSPYFTGKTKTGK